MKKCRLQWFGHFAAFSGILLTLIFSSIAFWVAAVTQDKAKGIDGSCAFGFSD